MLYDLIMQFAICPTSMSLRSCGNLSLLFAP